MSAFLQTPTNADKTWWQLGKGVFLVGVNHAIAYCTNASHNSLMTAEFLVCRHQVVVTSYHRYGCCVRLRS